ncbi:MAG TPA: hypothetical protein VKD69_00700 [Vicinamibacterales bacterium]|nr:hypothetical protein [Vicinamibacterales bacterium]
MSNRFSVTVEGIDEIDIAAEVEQAVRDSFKPLALPGAWHVTVKPSRIGGRWDFCIAGLDVRHTLSISVPARLLPGLIPSRLVDSLNRIVRRRTDSVTERVLTLQRVG